MKILKMLDKLDQDYLLRKSREYHQRGFLLHKKSLEYLFRAWYNIRYEKKYCRIDLRF